MHIEVALMSFKISFCTQKLVVNNNQLLAQVMTFVVYAGRPPDAEFSAKNQLRTRVL